MGSLIAAAALSAAMLNPAVTQANIHQTICVPGYTNRIRPPRSLIDRYERRYLPRGADPRDYVVDHIINLGIGGNPRPPNLQIQRVKEARRKDVLERRLQRAVCAGKISLRDAQLRMEAWRP